MARITNPRQRQPNSREKVAGIADPRQRGKYLIFLSGNYPIIWQYNEISPRKAAPGAFLMLAPICIRGLIKNGTDYKSAPAT